MKTKDSAYKETHQNHYLLKCPHCGIELVISQNELKREKFEPHEEEYEYWQGGFGPEHKKIGKRMVTSDFSKDVYKDIKCCYCGHVWDELVKGFDKKLCNPDGQQSITFDLGEHMTEKAKAFAAKHAHTEEFKKMGKFAFTTLGQQFTYTITPGGLGDMVDIKCNLCKEHENITCTEDW